MELTEQSHSALVEFDAYDGFRSVPDAMEYLMAATVFSQPPPNLEEPMRHIVYFDPEFDTQISWGAGQSTISRTAPIYPAAGTIFRLPASEVDHTVSRVKECHQSIAVRVPCGGARQAALTETIDNNRADRLVQEEMRAPPVCGMESYSAN